MSKKQEKFPEMIYVQKEDCFGTDDSFLSADDKIENLNDGTVAVYLLSEVGAKSTEVHFS